MAVGPVVNQQASWVTPHLSIRTVRSGIEREQQTKRNCLQHSHQDSIVRLLLRYVVSRERAPRYTFVPLLFAMHESSLVSPLPCQTCRGGRSTDLRADWDPPRSET